MKYILIIVYFKLSIFALDINNIWYTLKTFNHNKEYKKKSLNYTKLNSKLKIYDATHYKNKLKKNEFLFPKIHLIYQRELWSNWDDIESRNILDIKKITDTAKNLKFTQTPYIIDIEHWDVHTLDDEESNKNITKYIKVIKLFKELRPNLKFGFYGVLPNRDYWTPVSNNKEKIRKWNIINQRLRKLAKYVDVICPSLYTFYDNREDWNIYARENIKKAKKYNKPIYAFIWPQFHDSNKFIGGQYLDKFFWEQQLNVLKDVDAIVIWGGWNFKSWEKDTWKESQEWWRITKKFILTNSLQLN